ncbi:MAG: ABC transporter permease subunit, partial [Candidatus Zixiibacteriota bacterium]
MSPRLLAQLALLPDYLGHHLLLTVIALTAGIVTCIPLAVLVTRVRRLQWPTLAVAGVLQTIPGIALLALMVPLLGTIGYLPALVALILYSMLPILRNTVTGIQGVDPAVIEAARGIGMTDRQRLLRVELPLALPVIVAGIRTSAVWVVGTATLSTPVGATSLGNYIFSGLQTQNYTAVLVGCVSAALLAIALDLLIRLAEEGLRHRSRARLIIAGLLMTIAFVAGLTPMLKPSEAGKKIVVGAKTFTEQYILSDLIAMRLERSGYRAEAVSSLGSTVLFDALVNNSVDCCVDYSGTIWANHMKRTDRVPADSLLREMSVWLQQTYGIRCVGALGFENT